MESCPNQQSPCPHCHTLLPNSLRPSHTQTCPSYPIPCPHTTLGCPQHSLPRSLHPQHMQSCPFTPLSPLLNTILSRLANLEHQAPSPPDPEIDRLRADLNSLNAALGELEIRFSNAVVAERIRMGEEVERLRSQVGVLRRDVWFSRRSREWGAGALEGLTAATGGTAGGSSLAAVTELVSARRLSGLVPFLE